ncbi:WAT1-related protein [Vitis vinifera]|uniref:WAT1-related protein n=1 Tax=Vitis vinifera TaxID=29760 RepID=A0A438ERZ4_VITVI|nr:WAT1-related protein [Vitis vinifera]
MFGWTGRQCEWTMCELQWVGNEEKRASSSVHVQPIGTVCSVILSVMTLGESISIGSLCGMCLMFTGLYFVLWAKGKEGFQVGETLEPEPEPELENDVEKPLLG